MTIQLFNTLGRRIEPFVPIISGRVGLYTCGPTVWNYAHVGNLRTYIFEDILKRALEYAGLDVRHIMNITDVGHLAGDGDDGEDKMIKGARETGRTVWEIAEHYTKAFFADLDALNIRRPNVACRATDHIDDMIALIERLDRKGFAYVSGGNVYFDTSKFDRYGELALLDRHGLRPGARIAIDRNKRNPADFVLWFTRSKFEHQVMVWDSPWGVGYPGWHIECSAMSMRYLGEHFDIHCGGVDHIPVHHTNEIAQSEAATGKRWVNVWLHGEYLLAEKRKMAKSDGNFLTLSVLVDRGYEALDYRYLCLGAHYRSQLQFSDEAMAAARVGRRKLVDRISRLREGGVASDLHAVGEAGARYLSEMEAYISDDLGVPQALATLWTMLRDDSVSDADKLAAAFRIDEVFGLDLARTSAPAENELEKEYRDMIAEREAARERKDYARADQLRERLAEHGIMIEDTQEGTRWTRR